MGANFLLIFDASGSMHGKWGEKIESANQAASNLLEGLKTLVPEPELAIITFGDVTDMQDFTPVSQIRLETYKAQGKSPLDTAATLASAIASRDVITVLISDGTPGENFLLKTPLDGPAYAIAIGADADKEMLARFTGNDTRVLPPYAAFDFPGYALGVASFGHNWAQPISLRS